MRTGALDTDTCPQTRARERAPKPPQATTLNLGTLAGVNCTPACSRIHASIPRLDALVVDAQQIHLAALVVLFSRGAGFVALAPWRRG